MSLRFIEIVEGVLVRVDAILEIYVSQKRVTVNTLDTEHFYDYATEEDAKSYYEWLLVVLAGEQDEDKDEE